MPNDQPDPECIWCHYPINGAWHYCPKCGEAILESDKDETLPTADDVRGLFNPEQ